MLRIIDRYLFREIAATWLAVTLVLSFIMSTNQFARILGEVAIGHLPKDAVLSVLGLSALQYLTVLVPVSLFLSIMLALGRLYRDSEMSAMTACRIGPGGVYRPLLWIILPLAAGVGWLSLDTGPKAINAIQKIGIEAQRKADIASMEPGKFISVSEGVVVYAEHVPEPGTVENVFLQRRTEEGEIEVVVAERGEQRDAPDSDTRYFVLLDGKRYEGVPGSPAFYVMEFGEHGIPYQLPDARTPKVKARNKSTPELMLSLDLEDIAELHYRLSVPVATIILAILAVPLSRSQPRQGRYGKLAIGVLVFIIYFNLLSAGKAWLIKGTVDPVVGLWWVHGLMAIFALGMIALHNGMHRRLMARASISWGF